MIEPNDLASAAGMQAFKAFLAARKISANSSLVYSRLWRQVEDLVFFDGAFPPPEDARERLVKHLNSLVIRGLSPVTVRNHLVVARYYFEATGFPQVTEGLKCPVRVSKKPTPTLLEHESQALLAALERIDTKAKIVFHILLLTGLRLSEFLELKYTKDDLGARRLKVKNPAGKTRHVYIGEKAVELFGKLGKRRHPRGEKARLKLTAALRRAAAVAELGEVTPSVLRMTCIVRMLEEGMNPEFVALNAGLDKGSPNSRRRLRQAVVEHLERREEYRNGR